MSEYMSTVILISICKENLFSLLSLLFPWTLKSWYISGCHHCQQLAAITHSYSKAPGWPRRASEASRSTVQAPGAAAACGMLTPRWRAGGPEAKSNHAGTFRASAGMWLRSCSLTLHWPRQTSWPSAVSTGRGLHWVHAGEGRKKYLLDNITSYHRGGWGCPLHI